MRQFTAAELIARVAANKANWVLATRELKARGEYTDANNQAMIEAVKAADNARSSKDGYFSHQ